MRYLGQRIFCTGDINLATALMTMGFSTWEENPCEIIASDNGKTYGQFRFYTVSDDGKYNADECNDIFSGAVNLHHPFTIICNFIRRKPASGMGAREWLEYAFDDAKNYTQNLPRYDEASASDYVNRHPNNAESYGFAFAINRRKAFELISKARRSYIYNNGNGAAAISSDLPKTTKKELLGRLQ